MHRFLLALCALAVALPAQLRLPTNVKPTGYKATLKVTPGLDTFAGSIEIALDIAQPTADVTMHAKELEIHDVTPAPASIQHGANDLVTLHYASPLAAGALKLMINYTGTVSRVLTDGAFQQKHDGDWYVFTKFEPITARRVFPCFDEPGFKVPWQLTLMVPKDLKAFSNTPVDSEQVVGQDSKLVRFKETRPLPSYLVAFAVGPFDVVDTAPVGENHVPSHIVVPKGRAAEAAYAASITPKLIGMLEGYFGTPYPYEKLDQVIVPLTTAWGAMENAGMIAYGADLMLAPKAQDSELRHERTSEVMEHEMSHQWFGDLVTMQWWNDLWLNEAFASWVSSKLVAGWHPEWRIDEVTAASTAIFRADSLTSARRIRQPIEAAGDIGTAFDGITYGKGQAVIGMFEHYVGAQAFQEGVRAYLKAHAFGNATSDDLMAALDRVAPKSGVGEAFGTFLNQTGFPVVGVSVDCTHKPEVRLTQVRMVPRGSTAKEDATWDVPVCLAYDQKSQCVLLKKAVETFELDSQSCPSSVFADAGGAGYYATSYSSKPVEGGLSGVEKAAYERNMRVLFGAGLGDLEQEFQATEGFSKAEDPILVGESATLVDSVADLVPADLKGAYAARVRELYGQRAHELGWHPKEADTPEVRALRGQLVPLVATEGGDKELATEARTLAEGWLKDRTTLAAEVVPAVLEAAAYNGGADLFGQMETALKATKVQRERGWIIGGMSGFRDPAIAKAALDLIGAPGIDARETSRLLFSANAETRQTVWQYVQANFDKLNQMLPGARGVPFGATLPGTAAGFCDTAHAAEVSAFFQPKLEGMPGGARNLATAVERIKLCAAQAEVAKPVVTEELGGPIDKLLAKLDKIQHFGAVSISPDGRYVTWTEEVEGGKSRILFKPQSGGGQAIEVMAGGDVAWSKDSARFAFVSDEGGSQQVYVASADDPTKAKQLTNVSGDVAEVRWSPDGKQVAFLYTEGGGAGGPLAATPVQTGVIGSGFVNQRLYVADVSSGQTRAVTTKDLNIYEYSWSPEGARFAAIAAPGPADNNWWIAKLYTVEAATGRMTETYKPPSGIQIAVPRWSPDGTRVAFLGGLMSDEGFLGGDIYAVDAKGGPAKDLTPGIKISPSGLRWRSNGEILFTASVDGGGAIAKLNVASGTSEMVWKGETPLHEDGNYPNFALADDGETSAAVISTWAQAPEVWTGRIGQWKKATEANAEAKPQWGKAESVVWNNDGFRVQGWLLYPEHYDSSKRYPMVVSIHGGPASERSPGWPSVHFDMSAMAGLGYFVFFPNPRGSYGEGEAFTHANVKDFGYGDLRDVLSGVDAVLKKVPVDAGRIGVTGWSYGGYMTMWTVTQTQRFKAAVAGAGIADWLSYYGENSIDEWMIPYFGATVYDDPKVYAKSSPITFIKQVKTPTLVVVGERDGECPAPQSFEFWHALKTEGVPTELVVYPREGHSFREKEHRVDVMRRTLEWFDRYLGH